MGILRNAIEPVRWRMGAMAAAWSTMTDVATTRAARTALLIGAFLISGCVGATPRFPASVSAALADSDMHRMETEHLYLYYPASYRDEAVRIAGRLEGCAAALQQKVQIRNGFSRQKMVIVVPALAFNNAFVAPPGFGTEGYSVIPTHNTFDFGQLGLPADPSYIGCHEVVHYVHGLQVAGFWRWLNVLFGPLLNPQNGVDPWIFEGLATFYESRLQPQTGRQAWPAWRGMFHAGVANDRLGGGDLSAFKRASQWSNHYQVSSFFIEFLVERYGEDKIWQFLGRQGRSIFSFFGVGVRFRSVYGKSLSALLDEFANWTAEKYPPQSRPAGQRMVRYVGRRARYARAPNGVEAILSSDRDAPVRLRIYRPDGSLWQTHVLNELLPPRKLAGASVTAASGLTFTADGGTLYFTMVTSGPTFDITPLLALDIEAGSMRVVAEDIGGGGGAITPDGTRYFFGRPSGDRWDLARLDIATGTVTPVVKLDPRHYIMQAASSPDGTRLAVSEFSPTHGFRIVLYDAQRGTRLGTIDTDGRIAHDVSFGDDGRLLFLAEHDSSFQVFVHDLEFGRSERLSEAPYLAASPRAQGGTVRFLNREGWAWTLDEIALPARKAEPAAAITDGYANDVAATPNTANAAVTTAHAHGGAVRTANAVTPVATSGAESGIPAPVESTPNVISDTPYSHFDRLFVPQARGFVFAALSDESSEPLRSFIVGLGLSGADRLSFHNWRINGQVQLVTGLIGGSFGYVNTQLAPFTVGMSASQTAWRRTLNGPSVIDPNTGQPVTMELTDERQQRDAELYVTRPLYDSINIRLSAIATDDQRPSDPVEALQRRRMAGPSLALSYFSGDSTAYSGRYRALSASLRGSLYPELGNNLDANFGDVRAQLDATMPLPLSRRHTLSLSARGRRLVGLEDRGLLQLGGASLFTSIVRNSDQPEPADFNSDIILPTSIRFIEALRGFEDFAIGVDQVAIFDLSYRYPLIIDRGVATLWILPSVFVRQFNIELFGSAALDDIPDSIDDLDQRLHAAGGGALSLDVMLWQLPLSIRYQLSRRLTDDEALVHDFGFGFIL